MNKIKNAIIRTELDTIDFAIQSLTDDKLLLKYDDFSPVEKQIVDSFMSLLNERVPDAQRQVQTLKKATLNGSIVVVLSNSDKIVSKYLSDLTPEQAAPLNELLDLIGRDKEIIYTKSTNIMSIGGEEMPANNLGASPLLDRIEASSVELLNM